jgi:predicted GNAT superfamily acetyltransferase
MKRLKKILELKSRRFLFEIETSDDHKDYQKYENLRYKIWKDSEDNLAGTRNMMCENFLHDGSSLFIGVYVENKRENFLRDERHLVGFSYGFVGIKNKKLGFRSVSNLQFYSQYTGIRQDFRHFGLGILIKEFQREVLKDSFGIDTVTCTFDPLTGVNAYRNIHHFGMDIIKYKESYYGEFYGLLNRADVPCDRFFVSWDLEKKVLRPEYDLELLINSGCSVIDSEIQELEGQSGVTRFEVIRDMGLELDRELLLVEIPHDFYQMLQETDVSDDKVKRIPVEWRMKTRKVFQNLFKRNYKIIDFNLLEKDNRKRSFYILKR